MKTVCASQAAFAEAEGEDPNSAFAGSITESPSPSFILGRGLSWGLFATFECQCGSREWGDVTTVETVVTEAQGFVFDPSSLLTAKPPNRSAFLYAEQPSELTLNLASRHCHYQGRHQPHGHLAAHHGGEPFQAPHAGLGPLAHAG